MQAAYVLRALLMSPHKVYPTTVIWNHANYGVCRATECRLFGRSVQHAAVLPRIMNRRLGISIVHSCTRSTTGSLFTSPTNEIEPYNRDSASGGLGPNYRRVPAKTGRNDEDGQLGQNDDSRAFPFGYADL